MIIYKATCLITNKSYVGQTRGSLKVRQQSHFDDVNRRSNAFGSAIKKYGRNSFIWEIIAECNNLDELNQLEIHYIKELNTLAPNGYNLTTGGEGGFIRTLENKLKISKAKKGKMPKNHPALFKKGEHISPDTEFKGRKIVHLETGIIYDSIREASHIYNINRSTLAWRLRHKTIKNTIFAYVE